MVIIAFSAPTCDSQDITKTIPQIAFSIPNTFSGGLGTRPSPNAYWQQQWGSGWWGGVPMSHVDYEKWLCRAVDFKKLPCCPVNFKKWMCRPVDFKKWPCRPVDFKKVLCCLLLRTKKGHVALSIISVHTPWMGKSLCHTSNLEMALLHGFVNL